MVLAVGQRSSETGEPNGVSVTGSNTENPSSAPADEKWHMLLGPGVDRIAHLEVGSACRRR
jgi:hypothetical protein